MKPVQLTYTVKLVNPKNNPGESYGRYDEDGSEEYDGLYTNQKAVLHPVGSDQEKGKTEVFRNRLYIYDSGRRTFRRFQREELLNRRQQNSWMKILSLKWLCPCRQRRSSW